MLESRPDPGGPMKTFPLADHPDGVYVLCSVACDETRVYIVLWLWLWLWLWLYCGCGCGCAVAVAVAVLWLCCGCAVCLCVLCRFENVPASPCVRAS